MSGFIISQRPDGNYKFTYASRRGKTVFTGISCKKKSDCEHIIIALQKDLPGFIFTRNRTGSGKYFFRITRNGLVLATSRKFSTEGMFQKGIDQIVEYLPVAEILDFTNADPIFFDN